MFLLCSIMIHQNRAQQRVLLPFEPFLVSLKLFIIINRYLQSQILDYTQLCSWNYVLEKNSFHHFCRLNIFLEERSKIFNIQNMTGLEHNQQKNVLQSALIEKLKDYFANFYETASSFYSSIISTLNTVTFVINLFFRKLITKLDFEK